MNTNSNSYTIIYASIVVIIVAFLLAFVSSSLKDKQQANVRIDTQKQILSAINERDVKDVEAKFENVIKDMLMTENGDLKEYDGEFQTSYKNQKADKQYHVFVATLENGEKKFIIPIYGAGLWGPIWGYVALNDDKATVYGAFFSHEGETPGLGAEIANPKFQGQFPGKKVMDNGQVALSVVKHGTVEDADYQVDGISGGTITSKGVNDMLHNCMKDYVPFLTNKTMEEN